MLTSADIKTCWTLFVALRKCSLGRMRDRPCAWKPRILDGCDSTDSMASLYITACWTGRYVSDELGCQYSYNLITKSSPISRDEYQRFFPWETTSNLITVYVTSAFLEWDSTLCLGNVEREMCFHSPCWITVSLAYLFIDLGAGFHTSQEGSISE